METINNLTIQEVVAIFIAIEAVIRVLSFYFNKLYNMRHNSEDIKEKINNLNEAFNNQSESLDKIIETLKLQCRYDIVDSCLVAIKEQEIQEKKLQSTKELFEAYKNIGGNSYAEDLVERIKNLKIKTP